MYNKNLTGQEINEDNEVVQRPLNVSPRRMMYEQKFEKYMTKKINEQIIDREAPVEEDKFDNTFAYIDLKSSVNAKALKWRREEWEDKQKKMDLVLDGSSMRDGINTIEATRQAEENFIEADDRYMETIHDLFA